MLIDTIRLSLITQTIRGLGIVDDIIIPDPVFSFEVTPSNLVITEGANINDVLATYSAENAPSGLNYRLVGGEILNEFLRLGSDGIYLITEGTKLLEGAVQPNVFHNIIIEAYDGNEPTGVTQNVVVTSVQVDDAPTQIGIENATIDANASTISTYVGDFYMADSDSPNITFDFTSGTNTEGYYYIASTSIYEEYGQIEGTIGLSAAGADFVKAGGTLPNVSLTSSHGYTITNVVTTIPKKVTDTYRWNANGMAYGTITPISLQAGSTVIVDVVNMGGTSDLFSGGTTTKSTNSINIDGDNGDMRAFFFVGDNLGGSNGGSVLMHQPTTYPYTGEVKLAIGLDSIATLTVGGMSQVANWGTIASVSFLHTIGKRMGDTNNACSITRLRVSNIRNTTDYPAGAVDWVMNTKASDNGYKYIDKLGGKVMQLYNAAPSDFVKNITISVTSTTVDANKDTAGKVVAVVTTNDTSFSLTTGTNAGGYYAISGNKVTLTSAGYTYSKSNNLPNVSITTNTGKTASNTITTVNAAITEYAPNFNGTSQYMDVASRTYTGDFYFAFDVISTEKSKDWAVWDSVTFNNSNGAEALLYMDAPDGMEILFNANGIQGKFERYIFGGLSKICDGVKHTVKIERIGSTMNLWVDGVIFSTVNNVSTASIIVPNRIFGGNARYFKGIAYNADFNGIKFPMNEPFHQYPTLTSSTGTIMSAKNFVTANVVEINA